jgi:glycosyltransferase involved in cell wall biosynthesis
MQEVCGFEASLVGRFTADDYPALSTEMDGLNTIPLGDHGNIGFLDRAMVDYLREHSNNIAVLQLTHLARHTLLYGILYKRYNPNGFLILKLDAYNEHLNKPKKYARGKIKGMLMSRIEKRFFKTVDLVTVENTEGLQLAKNNWPALVLKLEYMPNGANDRYIDSLSELQQIPKENILLTVTRPGSEEKNCELLLDALPFLHFSNWKIVVVGEVTEAFAKRWELARAKFPEKAACIEFVGLVSDRDTLYELYSRSKIFFLASRVESFGISFAEALYCGNYLVGHSGMYAYDDLCAQGKYGSYFIDNDPASFADSLHHAVIMTDTKPMLKDELFQHAKSHFSWSVIAHRMYRSIESRMKPGMKI